MTAARMGRQAQRSDQRNISDNHRLSLLLTVASAEQEICKKPSSHTSGRQRAERASESPGGGPVRACGAPPLGWPLGRFASTRDDDYDHDGGKQERRRR